MSSHSRFDVWAGLTLAIALDTAVQLSWKSTVSTAPDTASPVELVRSVLSQPLFYCTIAMFLMQFFNWMRVLSKAELSFVQPITAMSYVTVSVCSVWLLHEHISLLQSSGIMLILLGVWFISQTNNMQEEI
jgi:drug/metabolite transporter (DMT)-like permease